MIPLIAEISWAGAFLGVGLMGEFAFVVWAVLKYGSGATTTATITEDIPDEALIKVLKESSRENVIEILREMGYPLSRTPARLAEVNQILTRDYTELMKKTAEKADDIRESDEVIAQILGESDDDASRAALEEMDIDTLRALALEKFRLVEEEKNKGNGEPGKKEPAE